MNAKQLYHQLLPFKDRNYFTSGSSLTWLLCTKSGTGKLNSVYCSFCGNIANNVGKVKLCGSTFNIPICKKHTEDYLHKHRPQGWSFVMPAFLPMNLKYVPRKLNLVIPDRPAPMQFRTGKRKIQISDK